MPAKTMGGQATMVTGWRVTVPDDDGEREIYRGLHYTDARDARRKDGSPSARFDRVDLNASP
jgi:hypothetical protein